MLKQDERKLINDCINAHEKMIERHRKAIKGLQDRLEPESSQQSLPIEMPTKKNE